MRPFALIMTTPTDIHKVQFSLGLGRFVTVIHTPIHTPPPLSHSYLIHTPGLTDG